MNYSEVDGNSSRKFAHQATLKTLIGIVYLNYICLRALQGFILKMMQHHRSRIVKLLNIKLLRNLVVLVAPITNNMHWACYG